MSEQDLGTTDESVGAENLPGDENFQAQDTEQVEAPAEKLIPQSQVNKLIGLKARQVEERAEQRLREREAELLAQQRQNTAGTGSTNPGSIEELMAQIKAETRAASMEAVQQLRHEQEDALTMREYQQKLQKAYEDDPDMVDAIEDLSLRPEKFGIDAEIIRMATKLDNTAQVLKELGQHPEKFSTLRGFLRDQNSRMAQKVLNSISSSIAQNEKARTAEKAPKPLSQLKPSNLGVGGGKVKTFDDMKAHFNNR